MGFSISFAGIVILILFVGTLYLYRKNISEQFQRCFLFSTFVSICANLGYVFLIGEYEVDITILMSVLMFFLDLRIFMRYGAKNILSLNIILFLISIFFSTLPIVFFNIYERSVPFGIDWDPCFGANAKSFPVITSIPFVQFFGMLLRILLFFCNIMALKTLHIGRLFVFKIIKVSKIVAIVFISLSFVEMLVANFVDQFLIRNFLINMFGGSTTSTYLHLREFMGIYLPLLTFKEPSAYVMCVIFLLFCEFLSFKVYHNFRYFITCLFLIFLLIISNTLSSIIYLGCFLLIVFVSTNNKVFKGIFIVLGIASCFVFYSLYSSRIETIFDYINLLSIEDPSLLPATSEVIRLYSIFNNLKIFLKYPLFGYGLGSCYSYSGLITCLANIGLLGLIRRIAIVISSLKYFRFNSLSLLKGIIVFFIYYSVIGSMGLMVYIDYSFVIIVLLSSSSYCEINKLCKLSSIYDSQYSFYFKKSRKIKTKYATYDRISLNK